MGLQFRGYTGGGLRQRRRNVAHFGIPLRSALYRAKLDLEHSTATVMS
jgi:hypothetical protein